MATSFSTPTIHTRWGDEGKTLTAFLDSIIKMQSAEQITSNMDKQQSVGTGSYHAYGVSAHDGTTLPSPPSRALHVALGFESLAVLRDAGWNHAAVEFFQGASAPVQPRPPKCDVVTW